MPMYTSKTYTKQKTKELILMLVIYTHQWPEAIWDIKGCHVIRQQNWFNVLY